MRPFGSPLVIECFELSEFADFRIGQVFGDLDLDGDIEVPGLGSALFGTDPFAADADLPACIRSFGDLAGNLFAVGHADLRLAAEDGCHKGNICGRIDVLPFSGEFSALLHRYLEKQITLAAAVGRDISLAAQTHGFAAVNAGGDMDTQCLCDAPQEPSPPVNPRKSP